MTGVRDEFSSLNASLVSGEISTETWYSKAYDIIRRGHEQAIRLGAMRAGVKEKNLDADAIANEARGLADQESEYLQGFLADIKAGRYTDDEGLQGASLDLRSGLYVGKMRGSANQAFVEESGDDDRFTWTLGPNDHCQDCPEYAQILVNVTADELFAYPGDGSTECLGNCTCVLVRSDGRRGFSRT